jgi:hypothetical protein
MTNQFELTEVVQGPYDVESQTKFDIFGFKQLVCSIEFNAKMHKQRNNKNEFASCHIPRSMKSQRAMINLRTDHCQTKNSLMMVIKTKTLMGVSLRKIKIWIKYQSISFVGIHLRESPRWLIQTKKMIVGYPRNGL